MDKTRVPDIKVVEQGLKNSDPNIRRQAMNAGNEIRKQSYDTKLKRRRQKLLQEIRSGRKENARDVQESIMGGLRTSMSMGVEDYERIFGK